jgi:AraC-like DNA-binding protein
MRLDYRLPASTLQPFTSVHAMIGGLCGSVEEMLPALLPNIQIVLRGSLTYDFGNGSVAASPVTLLGPTSRAIRLGMSADLQMLSIGLLPRGWASIVGAPAHSLADTAISAELIWEPTAVRELHGRLCEALAAGGDLLSPLEAFLSRRLSRYAVDRRHGIIDRWIEGERAITQRALTGELQLGERQVRRLTLNLYGTSPKTLAMKYRTLRSAARLATGNARTIQQALEGYADQPHMTHDFNRFIGRPPAAYIRERGALTAATMIGRWKAGAQRPLILWS